MLSWWTIGRATAVGAAGALASLILWPVYAQVQEPVLPLYLATLAVTAFCGLSILWITVADIFSNGWRGDRLRPVRVFDVAAGLLLAVLPLMTLDALLL